MYGGMPNNNYYNGGMPIPMPIPNPPVINYANQPAYGRGSRKRRHQDRGGYGDEDDEENSHDQVPDSLFSEVNLGIIEQQYQLLVAGKSKKNQEFLLYESKDNESICSA